MTPAARGSGLGYAIALGGVLALVLLHGFAGWPASSDILFLLFLAVITVAGWTGGFAPALGATVLATLLSVAYARPEGATEVERLAGQGRIIALALAGVLVALLARWAHDRGRLAVAEAERVRASEERFRLAAQAVQGVLYDLDPRMGRFWASEGLRRVIGVEPDPAGHTTAWWRERIHPDDLPAIEADLARLATGDVATWSGRYRVRHEDGRWVHIWDSARLLRDADGALVRVVGYSVDVSSQVEAEAALRASEERLRRATSVVRGLVYDIDFATGRVWRSDGLQQLVGVPADRAPEDAGWWYERLHPDDRRRFGDITRVYDVPHADSEYRVRHEDGRWVRVWDRMQVEHAPDGTPRRAIGFTMDVTELIAAREAQRATETRLQIAMDGLGLAWWDQDLATGHFSVSDSFLALYGLERPSTGPLSPQVWRPLVHPDDLPRLLAAVEAAEGGAQPQYAATYRIRRADTGEPRIVSAYGRHLRDADGTPVRWMGVILDVTEEERAREAQRIEDERLRLAVEGAGMGTWELDTGTGRVVWSPSYFRMLGYEPTPDGTAFIAWHRAVVHPEDGPRLRGLLDLALRTGGPYEVEYRVIRADDGKVRWLSSYGRFHYDDTGAAVRAVGVAFDVTARRRAEEALRQRAEEMEGLLSVLPAAVWYAHDPGCRMITANAYATRLTPPVDGRNVSATLPDDNRVWRLVAPEGTPLAIADMPLQRAVVAGRPVENVELSVQRPDGSRTPLLGGAVPLFDGDGAVRGAVAAFLDITDRKRVEEELREARLLLEKIAAAAPGIIYLYDTVERRNVYANRALTEILGYTPEEVQAAGGELGALVVLPEDASRLAELEVAQRAMRPGETRRDELRMRHKDGSIRWIRGHETVFSTAPDGSPRLILGLSLDVTHEKEALEAMRASEARLRESERRLRELADAMPQIVFVNRADGGIEFVNRQWELVTGEPWRSDPTVHAQVHPDDRASMLERFEASRSLGVPYAAEFRLRTRDGSYRWFLSRAVPVRDAEGRVQSWFGTSTDIDEQKRTQAALAEAEERQRALAEAALRINASLSVVQPLEATLRLVTDLARDILGAHQAQLLATREGEAGPVARAASQSPKYAALGGRDAVPVAGGVAALVARANRPVRLTRAELAASPALAAGPDGAPALPLRGCLAVPLVGRDGRHLGVLQFSDPVDGGDFSVEDEAVALQMAAMASVAMENWALVEQIREADRRKDEFLATLAHELRNPLAPISNSLELLRHADGDEATLARACGTMERQLAQLVRLIDDLLDASRISRGKLVLRRAPLTLDTVITQALETVRPHFERAGHVVTVALPAEPVWLDGDGTRLAQVFGNLLHNAAKYTHPGGHVTVRAECRGGRVHVHVCDTGIGIPAEQLRSIFEMFAQVDGSLERSAGGLGIGLALVKGLVEMHGGRIEARSDGAGQGSEFTVTLPVTPPPAGLAEASRSAAPALGRRRVLVADDNRDGADSLAALLRRSGHDVHVVYDGADAVEAAGRLQPHVVLLDLGMPRLNGHDAAVAIRQGPGGEAMVLVALTGWGDDATRRRTRDSGFDGHLTKPVDYQVLLSLLDALTEGAGGAASPA